MIEIELLYLFHRNQFQSQFADEGLDDLPVLGRDIFQNTLVLLFLLGHGVVLLSGPAVRVILMLILLDRLGILGRLGLGLRHRLLAFYLR